MFFRVVLLFLTVKIISAAYKENLGTYIDREKMTITAFNRFCFGKPRIDFCSDANLESMLHVLRIQREENLKKVEEVRQKTIQKDQSSHSKLFRLEKFFAANPKYKIMTKFGTIRLY